MTSTELLEIVRGMTMEERRILIDLLNKAVLTVSYQSFTPSKEDMECLEAWDQALTTKPEVLDAADKLSKMF